MTIKECIESLELILSCVQNKRQGEKDKITKLYNLKPSSFEFVLGESIEILEQVLREKTIRKG